MNGADVIAEILKREGVEYLTCFPHSEIIDSASAVGIRPILARTERGAVHIADGYARMENGRKMVATTMQYGPGVENAFGAVAQAFGDNVPVLCLPTGYQRAQQGVLPNFQASTSFAPVTKSSVLVNSTARIAQIMQHAFLQLRNGKAGPVLIETPTDLLVETVEPGADNYISVARSAPHADPAEIAILSDYISKARSPVILAGQGIFYADACAELLALAEMLQIPVMTTLNGKSAFPENHALALGTAASAHPWTVDHFLLKSDLIIGLGTSFTKSDYLAPIPDGKTLIQIVNNEGDLGKDYPISLGVVGDAKAVIGQLISHLAHLLQDRQSGSASIVSEIRQVRDAFFEAWMPLLTSGEEPINPYRVVWELDKLVDKTTTVVTHDAGSPRDQILPFYEAIVPHGYVGWGKTTQLGLGMPLMMGAKLARPDWLCINVMGDAAFGMIGMEFETAVRCNLPIMTIVLKNSVMGGYTRYLPIASDKHDIHVLSGDYAAVARALGGYAEEVSDPNALRNAMVRCIEQAMAGRPALLQVITGEETRFAKGQLGIAPSGYRQ
ncbi:acetolactate synthase-1/2/3 large subunit [Phyllobacterium trifolii]|uniref:Acetolactate synthase-1/2/3 large subunit n=1 Tax=Phyllobacterium trifolii TaxID=300193 RepID=A0A839UKM6_9HYPH|nr:thiamine pyrophosphate-requiring protein [Phyllobacterium trifolii]MBB3149171.1 acetolactate synthase-1/2/3 large subunit [Phyllobacterium trifolii]